MMSGLARSLLVVCTLMVFVAVTLADKDKHGQSRESQRTVGVVAFSAQTVNGFTGSTSADTTIEFNEISVNTGNAFSLGSSHFTAPVAGLYSFSYSFFPHYEVSSLLSAHLVVNNADAGGARCEYPNSASKTLIVQLGATASVWVELKASVDPRLSGDDIFNTFSGYLIYEGV